MKLRALFWWDRLRASLWFIPRMMAIAAAVLSFATLAVDHLVNTQNWQAGWWLYAGGSEGARAVLSVIASSMITVSGVVFSIMMVVLSLAAQQYGPRLLRNFMRDRTTQFVLGTFVATFLYCLMILRTIRGENGEQFIPQISVTCGVVLALVSLAVLIYFIHHVSASIHISEIISNVQAELLTAVDSIYPDELGKDEREVTENEIESLLPRDCATQGILIRAKNVGYLEAIEGDELFSAAKRCDLILRLQVQPGDYILLEQLLLTVWFKNPIEEQTIAAIRRSFLIGQQRTPVQDVLFALRRLIDIAVRALSPGINDPFTAMNCLDHLSEALCRLIGRRFPSSLRYDDENKLRVIAAPISFHKMVASSLGVVREYSKDSSIVTIKIVEIISRLASRILRPDDAYALQEQLNAIATNPYAELSPRDLARVRISQQEAQQQLTLANERISTRQTS